MARKSNADNEQLEWMLHGTRPREMRVERRVRKAIAEAKRDPDWSPVFDGLAIAAIATARSLDRAESIKPDPYAAAGAARELREQLRELCLTPASRKVEAVDADAVLLKLLADDDEDDTRTA